MENLTLFDFSYDTKNNNEYDTHIKISNYNDLVNNIERLETVEFIDYKSRIITKGNFNNGKVFYRIEYKDFYDEWFYSVTDLLEFIRSERQFLKQI